MRFSESRQWEWRVVWVISWQEVSIFIGKEEELEVRLRFLLSLGPERASVVCI